LFVSDYDKLFAANSVQPIGQADAELEDFREVAE